MKKLTQLAVLLLSTALLVSCKGTQEKSEPYVFKPSLDKETACEIKVVGDYKNFEALEAEFDRFNAYYPNVELSYEKIDNQLKMDASLESTINMLIREIKDYKK